MAGFFICATIYLCQIKNIYFAQSSFSIARLRLAGFTTQYGYLLKSGGKYHEKGVDVQLAIDIMKGAYRDTYDICYLVSSDTDLIPAIAEARSVGKKVVYVGFRHQISYALNNQCDESRLLTKSDILQFI